MTDNVTRLPDPRPDPDNSAAEPWWADHTNLALLAEEMGDADDIVYMLEKPWKFDQEFKAAQEREREDQD